MNQSKISTILLGILALIAIGFVLSALQSVALPFVIAFFLSYIFKPIVIFLRKKKIPMAVALLIVLLLVLAIISGTSLALTASARVFFAELPKYQMKLEVLLTNILSAVEQAGRRVGLITGDFNITDAIQLSSVTSIITSSVGTFISFFSNAFLVLLFMIFILAGAGGLIEKFNYMYADAEFIRISNVLATIDRKVRQYMLTKTLISLANGILAAAILSILGVDFAILWGFILFLLNFIPNIGSLIAILLPVLVALLQFDTLTIPLLALVLLVVAQNVIGNVIEPKVMAFSLNLSPLLILVSLLFWGWLWGIWGMILAVPIMSIVKIICDDVEFLKPVAVLMSGGVPKRA